LRGLWKNLEEKKCLCRNHRRVGEWRKGAEVSPKERAIKKEKYNKDSDDGHNATRDP
jgi:hypothetical protein